MAQLQMFCGEWLDQLLLVKSENYSSHNSLVWLLGFDGNHSLLIFVQYCRHLIGTRQIQYHFLLCRTLVELVHKNCVGKSFTADSCLQMVLKMRPRSPQRSTGFMGIILPPSYWDQTNIIVVVYLCIILYSMQNEIALPG